MSDRRCRLAAGGLVVAVVATAVVWGTRVAAGADAYGYVSQADLWLRHDLFIDQSFAAEAPWPLARWTFTPLGYRPEPDGYRIVPAYAPGLPVAMAAAKAIAGQCAVYWIVPLAAGILVLATYAIGAGLRDPRAGLGASWLVATSPTVLFMAMPPMSDLPAAAAWAAAAAMLLRGTAAGAAIAGAASAAAIVIRPNLAPLAAVLLLWLLYRRRFAHAAGFGAVAAAGVIVVAIVNTTLYGSPTRSGYDLTDAFAAANILPNLRRYGWWLITVETPIAVAGILGLVLPSRRVWPGNGARHGRLLLAGVAGAVLTAYLVYVPWEAWWYLRFLLPAFPMMAVAGAAVVTAAAGRAAPLAFALLGALGIAQAIHRDVFNQAAGESKYVEVARVVESLTAPGDVIVAAQHSGAIRFYAGRLTVRWDVGDPAWFDRMVEWLAARGHHPYIVVEDAEIDALRARAAAVSRIARLDWTPTVTFRGGQVKLFDPLRRESTAPAVAQSESHAIDACAPARTVPTLDALARTGVR